MLDIHVPEPLPDDTGEVRQSKRFDIPVVKAKDYATIEVSALDDTTYDEVIYLGLKALINRGAAEVTASKIPNEEERIEVAADIAKKVIQDMYLGKIRRSSGAKKGAGRGELEVEKRRLAKIYVKAELKEAGLRVSLIKPAEITKLANEMIANDSSIEEEAKANLAKRHGKTKGKKIDIAALRAKVQEDPELITKAERKNKTRKKVDEDEEEAPPPTRPTPGRRVSA